MKHSLPQRKKFDSALRIPLIVGLGCVLLSACAGPDSAPVRPTAVSRQTTTIVTQVTPTVAEAPAKVVFYYNAVGRRDPFAPLISKAEVRERAGSRPPLERYNISEFKLTGIVWGGFGYNAMVEGPDGKGYFIRSGTVIGPNKGIVKKITKDTMVIEEKFKNVMGKTESKQIVIEMRKKQEGMQ